jgi:hypothetical protein
VGLRWSTPRHVLKDPAHPVDDVVVVNLSAGHPRRVTLAGVLVAEGVVSHRRLHPPLHKAEGHMLGPQPGLSQSSDLRQQLG